MPSRRSVLAGTATAGAAAIAGCSSESLPPARLGETPQPPSDASVVARAETFHDADHPNGAYRLRSYAYEAGDDGDRTLLLFSDHGLVPEENQHAGNGWRLGTLEAVHDCAGAALVRSGDSNFDPANEGEGTVRLGRSTDGSALTQRWTLRFGDSGDATWGCTFCTEFAPEERFEEGDSIARVVGEIQTAKRWSLEDHTTELQTELRYGEVG